MIVIGIAIALLLLPVIPSQEIPVGTVIPVMLSTSLNASKDKPEKRIEGRVMQDVPLPSGFTIREGARVLGHASNVKTGLPGSSIVVKFDAIQNEGRTIPVTIGLLAVASMMSVQDAQSPISLNSDIEPVTQWVTRQVGGDLVRRGWGKVLSPDGSIGRWLGGSSVLARPTPNPKAGCSGGPGYDREQALWIFSSAACGEFGLRNLRIASSGVIPPLGEIGLTSNRNINIRGGSGWLLIVAKESSY
jgi:hypothetical protein